MRLDTLQRQHLQDGGQLLLHLHAVLRTGVKGKRCRAASGGLALVVPGGSLLSRDTPKPRLSNPSDQLEFFCECCMPASVFYGYRGWWLHPTVVYRDVVV